MHGPPRTDAHEPSLPLVCFVSSGVGYTIRVHLRHSQIIVRSGRNEVPHWKADALAEPRASQEGHKDGKKHGAALTGINNESVGAHPQEVKEGSCFCVALQIFANQRGERHGLLQKGTEITTSVAEHDGSAR